MNQSDPNDLDNRYESIIQERKAEIQGLNEYEFRELVSGKRIKQIKGRKINEALLVDVQPLMTIMLEDAIVADVINQNGRIYPRQVLREAYNEMIRGEEGDANGIRIAVENGVMTGEAEHPDFMNRPDWTETVVKWVDAEWGQAVSEQWLGNEAIHLIGVILPTTKGRDAYVALSNGVMAGGSIRGYGQSDFVPHREYGEVEEVTRLRLVAVDLVGTPSFRNRVSVVPEESPNPQMRSAQSRMGEGKSDPSNDGANSLKESDDAAGLDDDGQKTKQKVNLLAESAKPKRANLLSKGNQIMTMTTIEQLKDENPKLYEELVAIAKVRDLDKNKARLLKEAKEEEARRIAREAELAEANRKKEQEIAEAVGSNE